MPVTSHYVSLMSSPVPCSFRNPLIFLLTQPVSVCHEQEALAALETVMARVWERQGVFLTVQTYPVLSS
jgi:hypothetical protein